MKLYYTTIKTLVILFSIFSVNFLYGGDDDFSVTVSESRIGHIKEVRICYSLVEDIEIMRIPSFEVSASGIASPTFSINFNFNDQIPADGRLFEVRGYVYIKTGPQSYSPVTLNNNAPLRNYVIGSRGTTQGGEVNLTVTPNFNVLSNCSYYFSFTAVDVTPQMGGGNGSNTGNQESMGAGMGSQSVLSGYILSTPKLVYTKDIAGCETYTSNLCASIIEEDPTNTERTSFRHQNTLLDIFPNPTSNGKVVLQFDFQEQISRNLNIEVLNTQGQLMKREQVHVTAAQTSLQRKLDIRELPAGIYLVKVDTGIQQLIQKLVIQ